MRAPSAPRAAAGGVTPVAARETGVSHLLVSCALLFYLLIRPVGSTPILLAVLAVFVLNSVVILVRYRRRISPELFTAVFLLVLVGLLGALIGSGNPGLSAGVLVWVVAPLMFGAWAAAADKRMLKWTIATIVVATLTSSVGILLYIGGNTGVLPQLIPESLITELGGGFDGSGGGTAIRFLGLSTLTAAGPLCVTAAVLPRHPLLPRRWLLLAAAVAAAAAGFLAGRDVIVLVIFLVPPLIWLLWALIRKGPLLISGRTVFFGLTALAAGALLLPWILSLQGVQNAFASVRSFFTGRAGAGGAEGIRVEQAGQLLRAWAESPFVGHGLGAVIPGYVRNADRHWEFELQYHLYLFQFGLLGYLLLIAMLIVVLAGLWRVLKEHPAAVPVVLVAMSAGLAMLVSNATNPYLAVPGHMWASYLPLMAMNIYRVSNTDDPPELITPRSIRSSH